MIPIQEPIYLLKALVKWHPGLDIIFKPRFCTERLYRAGENLGYRDKFCYESCPWCRIARLTSWPAVPHATSVLRLSPTETWHVLNSPDRCNDNHAEISKASTKLLTVWKLYYHTVRTTNLDFIRLARKYLGLQNELLNISQFLLL